MAKARLFWSPGGPHGATYNLDPDHQLYEENLRMMGAMGRAILLVHLECNARRIRQFVHRQECSEDSCRHG